MLRFVRAVPTERAREGGSSEPGGQAPTCGTRRKKKRLHTGRYTQSALRRRVVSCREPHCAAHRCIGSMVVKAKSAAALKRQETLNLKRVRYEQKQQAKLDLWCTEHDEDGNGEFDRQELSGLLNALYPEHTLGEDMLDQLMERATGVYTSSLTLRGDKNGRVTKKALFKTVSQYECCEPPLAPRRTHALAARIISH